MSRREPGAHVANYYGASIYVSTSPHWAYEVFPGYWNAPLVVYCETLAGARQAIRDARERAGFGVSSDRRARYAWDE